MDMLEDIFQRNKKFTDFARANSPRGDMPEDVLSCIPEVQQQRAEVMMLRVSIAMMSEVMEFTNETPWKWWGRGKNKVDNHKALEELADLLHFFMIAVDDLGFTAQDLHKAYVLKNDHNWKRFHEKIGWGKNDKEHQDSPLDKKE
jgi:hypothetical protein